MAQFDCFLCEEEKIELINLVFSLKLLLVPDLSYDSEHYCIIKNIEEYKNYVYKNELFFIVNSKIQKEPFVFGSFEKNGKRKFFIRQRYGIPSIDFYSPGATEKAKKPIGSSFISSYPFYYNKTDQKIYPSAYDKNNFKEITTYVKKRSIPIKVMSNRTWWVGKKSIELCKQNNYKLMNIGDYDLIDYI